MRRLSVITVTTLLSGCAAFQTCNPPAAGTFCPDCPEGSNGICCATVCCEGDCIDGVCQADDLTAESDDD